MQEALLACIPAVISISYSPGGSSRTADAVVQTIASRLVALQESARESEARSSKSLNEPAAGLASAV